jgi:glutaredoxin
MEDRDRHQRRRNSRAGTTISKIGGLRVFWMPGCSSSIKVREFLKNLGVPYQSVNVLTAPKAESDLRDLGALSFPVVSRGREFVCAQSLDDVAKFLGRDVKFERLAPAELMDRWFYFCDIALELIDDIPQHHLQALPIPNRNRTVHGLSYHIFQVPEAFLQNAENGEEHFDKYFAAPAPEDVKTSADIRFFGELTTERLRHYWQTLPDRSFSWTVKTFYGTQPSHHLLERSVWHMAQHIRQLQVVLDSYNVTLNRRIDESKYEGLPMPTGVWE